jgi:uncharacterized membrane protein (UPF0127 family)
VDQPTSTTTVPPTGGAWNETRNRWLAAEVEVAGSVWARFKGLMGRRELRRGAGLWLPGDNGIHMFFMRFAIDAVFLGRPQDGGGRRVVAAKRRVRPWIGLVPFVGAANGVLELPAGTIADTGTEVGDVVHLR